MQDSTKFVLAQGSDESEWGKGGAGGGTPSPISPHPLPTSMLRRAPSLPLASLASRLVLPSHRPASHAVAHGHDDHHGPPLDGPDVHPTLRTPAYHPGTRTHQPPALLPDTPSVLPPALKARIPPLPEEEDRPVRTDPRILPLPGNRFWGVYDHLSAVNPVTTRRPIWDVGPRESRRWPDGKVPPLWLIEYGWEKMDEEARARLEGHLKDRQKQDWRDLSLVEKKASESHEDLTRTA